MLEPQEPQEPKAIQGMLGLQEPQELKGVKGKQVIQDPQVPHSRFKAVLGPVRSFSRTPIPPMSIQLRVSKYLMTQVAQPPFSPC